MDITFDHACALVGEALRGSARRELVNEVSHGKTLGRALQRLRERLRANEWNVAGHHVFLDRMIGTYDGRTRGEGFHILHDWDGVSQQVNPEIIPVDVLDFLIDQRGNEPANTAVPAIVLDYYFMHVLALLTMRIWDDGDPDRNLDAVDDLLHHLQGPFGSGQRFAADAETLMLIGTSHYELKEWGYARLLDKVRTLNDAHQARIGIGHASSMGCHLRFGFEAQCGRDTVALRNDNVADYPWLCFALAATIKEYDRNPEPRLEEAILNGLTPDARAFVGVPPSSLANSETDRAQFVALFDRHRPALMASFQQFRPSDTAYSPLSFFFNFSHNVIKGAVVDAALWAEPWDVTMNDLLTSVRRDELEEGSTQLLATTLMGYARSNPDRIRGRLMPVIVYDPQAGRRAYSVTMEKLSE